MAKDNTKLPLQEAVLSLLCYDQKAGAHIAASVNHTHFDDVYGEFAQRVLQYRRKYSKPPGKAHILDIARRLSDGKDTFVQQRLLPRLQEDFNVDYVVSRVEDFVQRQVLKRAIIEAGDRFETENDDMLPEVQTILHQALNFRQQTLDAGMFLSDPRGLDTIKQNEDMISLGIPILDRLGIGLTPKEMLLYIGPKNSGKTWFCCHCGKQSLLARKYTLHVTLEMSEPKILRRYYQALFGVARKVGRVRRARLLLDDLGRFNRFRMRRFEPKLAFTQRNITRVLRTKIKDWGTRFDRMVVKQFPTRSLTIPHLASYLDYLGDVHQFIPNVLIVDYPDLMSASSKNYRLEVGDNFEGLRGLAVARNMALVAPTQGARKTIHAARVRSSDAAEDIRKVNASDTVMSFSQTEEEKKRGLGRLSVEHARDNESGAMILLSQSYSTGQYVLDSVLMQSDKYWEQIRRASGGRTTEGTVQE